MEAKGERDGQADRAPGRNRPGPDRAREREDGARGARRDAADGAARARPPVRPTAAERRPQIGILFVDDESRILDGLRRMFFAERHRWRTEFANSGAAAIALLAQQPFDVVVSDMRMPNMDGARLLEFVRTHYPDVVRIVLSGQAETEVASRAMAVAHQFLSKPLNGVELVALLDRVVERRTALQHARVRAVAQRVGTLPPAPRVYQLLTRRLRDPGFTVDALETIVRSDADLSANVLHLANSAFFGRSGKLSGLRDAVAVVGTEAIRQFVLHSEMLGAFGVNRTHPSFSLEAFREHCVFVASLSAAIVEPPGDREGAFAAGMLHDAGRVVIASQLPQQTRMIEIERRRRGSSHAEAEQAVLGLGHAELGAYLFTLWGLPEVLVNSVQTHSHLEFRPGERVDVAQAVAVAEDVAYRLRAANRDPGPSRFGSDPRYDTWRSIAARLDQDQAA